MVDIVTARPHEPGIAPTDGGSPALDLVGRILLASIFVSSGISKLMGWPGVVGQVAGKGLPFPEVAGAIAIAIELGGAFALVTGIGLRIGALALVLFCVVAALLFHNFWAFEGAQYTNQYNHFMKVVAIIGGLLVVAARPRRDDGMRVA